MALSCFQPRRGPVGFGAAPSGKAPCIAPPAAFSRYKDLHRSLLSHFPSSFFHISWPSPAPSRIARVCAPLSHILVSTEHRRSLCLDLCMRHCAGGLSLRDYIAATLTLALSTYLLCSTTGASDTDVLSDSPPCVSSSALQASSR